MIAAVNNPGFCMLLMQKEQESPSKEEITGMKTICHGEIFKCHRCPSH